jgi:two-component system, sensor histidine kinase PdtaS
VNAEIDLVWQSVQKRADTLFVKRLSGIFSKTNLYASAYRLLLLVFFLSSTFLYSQSESATVVQLRQEIKTVQSDSARARLSGLLAWELKFTKTEEAIVLADTEISIARKQQNYLQLSQGYRVKALALVIGEKIVVGMPYYDSALVYAKKAGSLYYQSSCYSLMAGMYGDHGDYDKAIELYGKGLEIAQQSADPKMIATLSNNLAEAYQNDARETHLIQQYFSLALENSLKIDDWPKAGMNSANLANEYMRVGENEKAKMELQRAIDLLNRGPKNDYQYATNSHVIASVYFGLNNMQKAEEYALISMHLLDSLEQPDNVLRPLSELAAIYVKTKNVSKAETYSTRLLENALEQNAKRYIRDAYKDLSDIARMKNNDKDALRFFELYKSWNDSIFEMAREESISNIEMRSLIAQKELEVKYETKKKAEQNETLKTENDRLGNEKTFILIACLIFLLLGFLLFLSNRKKEKANAALEAEKKIVEQQAIEKGMLLHEIHHRVKNNLTMLKSMLYLQAKASDQSDTKRILEESQARIQSMALVHQNLYEDNESGKLDFVPFLENMFMELSTSFRPQDNDVAFEVVGNCPQLNIETAIPLGLIMNELVTNSLKYAFKELEEGEIRVFMEVKNEKILILYSDNGPGLKKQFNLSTGGFGFKLLHILSNQLNATIDYQKAGSSSVFSIELPLIEG